MDCDLAPRNNKTKKTGPSPTTKTLVIAHFQYGKFARSNKYKSLLFSLYI